MPSLLNNPADPAQQATRIEVTTTTLGNWNLLLRCNDASMRYGTHLLTLMAAMRLPATLDGARTTAKRSELLVGTSVVTQAVMHAFFGPQATPETFPPSLFLRNPGKNRDDVFGADVTPHLLPLLAGRVATVRNQDYALVDPAAFFGDSGADAKLAQWPLGRALSAEMFTTMPTVAATGADVNLDTHYSLFFDDSHAALATQQYVLHTPVRRAMQSWAVQVANPPGGTTLPQLANYFAMQFARDVYEQGAGVLPGFAEDMSEEAVSLVRVGVTAVLLFLFEMVKRCIHVYNAEVLQTVDALQPFSTLMMYRASKTNAPLAQVLFDHGHLRETLTRVRSCLVDWLRLLQFISARLLPIIAAETFTYMYSSVERASLLPPPPPPTPIPSSSAPGDTPSLASAAAGVADPPLLLLPPPSASSPAPPRTPQTPGADLVLLETDDRMQCRIVGRCHGGHQRRQKSKRVGATIADNDDSGDDDDANNDTTVQERLARLVVKPVTIMDGLAITPSAFVEWYAHNHVLTLRTATPGTEEEAAAAAAAAAAKNEAATDATPPPPSRDPITGLVGVTRVRVPRLVAELWRYGVARHNNDALGTWTVFNVGPRGNQMLLAFTMLPEQYERMREREQLHRLDELMELMERHVVVAYYNKPSPDDADYYRLVLDRSVVLDPEQQARLGNAPTWFYTPRLLEQRTCGLLSSSAVRELSLVRAGTLNSLVLWTPSTAATPRRGIVQAHVLILQEPPGQNHRTVLTYYVLNKAAEHRLVGEHVSEAAQARRRYGLTHIEHSIDERLRVALSFIHIRGYRSAAAAAATAASADSIGAIAHASAVRTSMLDRLGVAAFELDFFGSDRAKVVVDTRADVVGAPTLSLTGLDVGGHVYYAVRLTNTGHSKNEPATTTTTAAAAAAATTTAAGIWNADILLQLVVDVESRSSDGQPQITYRRQDVLHISTITAATTGRPRLIAVPISSEVVPVEYTRL